MNSSWAAETVMIATLSTGRTLSHNYGRAVDG